MPTNNLPSSFASAAAGQNAHRDSRGPRGDGRGNVGGDWSRRDGRSANGTLTFRRSSTTPLSHSSQHPPAASELAAQDPLTEMSAAEPSVSELGPSRYSREELLTMFRPELTGDPSHLFMAGWNPNSVNGGVARAWGKSNENHVPQEPGVCWDASGSSVPLGLTDLTAEEQEAFSTDINSPLKPPTQQNKEGSNPAGANGRKASLSQGATVAFGLSSPSSARPATRRRETIESNPFGGGLGSPTAAPGRGGRDDSWFPRRGGELREDMEEAEPESAQAPGKPPFGSLMRANTAGSAGIGSIWGQSNPGTPGAGAFGSFSLANPNAERTGSSRLAHLMPKDVVEGAQSRQGENQTPLNQQSWRARQRTDTDPFGEDILSGSAALGGAQEPSGNPIRFGNLGTPVKGSAGDFGMAGINLGGQHDEHDPLSPSETNPYRSPAADRHDGEGEGSKNQSIGQEQSAPFNPLPRGFGGAGFEDSDRSQTSSAGAKGFLSHGPMSAWAAPGGPSSATPDRERSNFSGFPTSLFSGDLQSPGLGNLTNVFSPAGAGGGIGHGGSIGRNSKLGSLFPAAMQAQMGSHEHDNFGEPGANLPQGNPLGAIGRGNFGTPTRENESPMRPGRGIFEELFPPSTGDAARSHSGFGNPESGQPATSGAGPQPFTPTAGGMSFGGGVSVIDPPSGQARTMVMPDRMRWVYLDPQGQIQGPFTGLEMNDWYKAQFFSPDLRVRKVEDPDFEPLGQLIRRIGNSREPFLVPQIGIPHGPPTGGTFTAPGNGSVVPPLSGVFPSFGRTLTAEEQNNLERRKQEEQLMMAQQREYIMRQQAIGRFNPSGQPLQHQNSAHSLHSQPSFGSITSPVGMHSQQQQPIGAMPQSGAFFESPTEPLGPAGGSVGQGSGNQLKEDDISNLSLTERQMLVDYQGGQPSGQQPIGAPALDNLRSGLPETGDLEEDLEGFKGRLEQFEDLRAQHDADQAAAAAAAAAAADAEPSQPPVDEGDASSASAPPATQTTPSTKKGKSKKRIMLGETSPLSLTQQVQQTQQAAAAAAHVSEPGMPMPFPPPASTTPLPAPTAQRVRSNLPEQYSRSRSGSPEEQTDPSAPPPLAPWAKEPGNDAPKGPSLKEIQEAEALKAAKAEEAAAAARKAALEQEASLLREREKAAAAAQTAGLPATSTWGHASPVATSSPWSKPNTVASPVATGSAASKKTLADIQREEERRKARAQNTATQSTVAQNIAAQVSTPPAASKSYANLAGKPGQSPISAAAAATAGSPMPTGAGWATVGAGGKVKIPTGPAAQTRSVSATVKPAIASPIQPLSRPANPPTSNGNVAMEEFKKWVHRELSRGITTVNDLAGFQASLDQLPLDQGIIADAVYANSTTMDGRHFAEEFIRRKKLAEKGVATPAVADAKPSGSGGGWSEVAKKSNAPVPKDTGDSVQAAGFKVVPSRKKGKK